jgi:hypothetical protein
MIWLAETHASRLSRELTFCSFFFVVQAVTAAVRQTVYWSQPFFTSSL